MSTLPDTIRVLYVDDDPEFADTASAVLEREDARLAVESAEGAEEALRRLDDRDVDCVVSNYDMPGRDGVDLLEAVRESYPKLPFIIHTGEGDEDVANDAISAGVTHYLQKEPGTDQYGILADRIRDAVGRYRTRVELADRKRRLELFFEQSPLGVIEWDDDFEAVRVNSAAEDILGYTESELEGRSWEVIVPESDQESVDDVVAALLTDEGGYHSVNENVRKDGERVICEWHNRVVTDDDGTVVAVFSQFRDVTERERNKRSLERQNERLEEFAGIVSHDLRNPLNVARGRAELLQTGCDGEHLDALSGALGRMERLIDELLTLAREGEAVTDTEPVPLADVVEAAWGNVDTSNAELAIDVDATVRADLSRVTQLFENLFRNAVEHAGEDATITVGEVDDATGFYVADDGPGIPEGKHERVFESGYTTSDGGTGFGLAIVREIVQAHDWTVRVTDGEAGGARFEVVCVEPDDR